MDKLTIATQVLLKLIETDKTGFDAEGIASYSFEIADAMQAEADKRNKAEAAQKRKEIREMLNADNTFIEREGQHFDDLTPTWDQGPNVLTAEDSEKYKNMIKREFVLYNNPPPKIEKRKSIHEEESDWQPDWSQAPEWANSWGMAEIGQAWWLSGEWHVNNRGGFSSTGFIKAEKAPSFDYQGNWKDSLRKRPEALCEVDWRVAPQDTTGWKIKEGRAYWIDSDGWIIEDAPTFGFTGTHIVERPHGF